VLTVIGDDRAGLVEALSDVVAAHGGNWEHSQLAELAGKFAGIVVISAPADRIEGLTASLHELDGLLDVSAQTGTDADAAVVEAKQRLAIDLIGNDSPGIVHDVSGILARHHLSIEKIDTATRDAPMTGGRLFEAHIVVTLPRSAEPAAVRADLERLATELVVEIAVTDESG
jgi:glycine cleavage system regulatory protein